MPFADYHVNGAGVVLAGASGFSAWFGWSVLHDMLYKKPNDGEDDLPVARVLRRAAMLGLGGRAVTFGAFAFMPRVFRSVWMA